MSIGSMSGDVKIFGLVRDKNGKPKIDNLANLPEEIWNMLTEDEKEELRDGRNTSRNSS